ncbi:hypothetical protein F5Y16DRAFT_296234 [Xylariaceae sp. FL0255]|nr:hypothetical protein F5Y16DRAFT_296234 [Xylariaceae sp. FL0255]
MSDIVHKVKDAVHGHHDHDHDHDTKERKFTSYKHHANKDDTRNNRDLNGATSATKVPNDLTGRHPEPDHRDIDGLVHSTSHDAPDLTGPHKDHINVDINGAHAATHTPPDLNSPAVAAGAKR